jgi:hypothetical protein
MFTHMHGQQRSRNAFIPKQHQYLSKRTEESNTSLGLAAQGYLAVVLEQLEKKDADCENVLG